MEKSSQSQMHNLKSKSRPWASSTTSAKRDQLVVLALDIDVLMSCQEPFRPKLRRLRVPHSWIALYLLHVHHHAATFLHMVAAYGAVLDC